MFALAISAYSYGQDLLQRVPQEADFIAVVNNQAIVKHSSYEKINELLAKLGAFDAINAKSNTSASSVLDLDLAYDRNAYIYKTDTDSSYYIGAWIPLKAGHHVGTNIFSDFIPVSSSNGYEQVSSADGKTQIAWNENSLFLLTGDYKNYYFQNDTIAARYGIDNSIMVDAAADAAADPAAYAWFGGDHNEWDTADSVAVDSVADSWEEIDFDTYADTIVPPPPVREDVLAPPVLVKTAPDTTYPEPVQIVIAPAPIVDTASTDWTAYDFGNVDTLDTAVTYDDYDYQYDSYDDEAYQHEMLKNAKNDSIRNAAFATWLAADFVNYLEPSQSASSYKQISQYDKQNTLVHFWVKNLNDVYQDMIPYDVLRMGIGLNMKNLDYGYQDAVIDLIQDKHILKIKGSIGLEKDIQKIFAQMYKRKANKKFAKYIPENHLGYLSLNVNTEAYLNSIPALFDRWYGPLLASHSDLISIAGTALEIALDEKAIAKIMAGDHLVFINDLKKVQKEYIDYEFDEEYNYTEVTKTKEEEIINFLWMFTSEDQRIFKKLLAYAEKQNVASESNGVYRISEKENVRPIFIVFKDDIAFVGTDQEQLEQINNNTFRSSNDASVKKQIFANNMTATVHTAEIPEVINKLGVPIVGEWHKTVRSLSNYGDITLTTGGVKKNRVNAEFSVAFPKNENNALQYLLQHVLDALGDLK